jgi:tRNA nucleotidyltransferase (CCA-adding enzyme)
VSAHPLVQVVRPHLRGDVSAVGGAVRDAMLRRPPGPELDLVVEGDAIAVARRLGEALAARVVTHPRFRTAQVRLERGRHVDLVSARTETYAAPGALPTVADGSLADDLARRDFTINAMAVGLSGSRAGELIDPGGGAADLEAGLVRALRPDAFSEDPSRIVRAARYAARLGFALAPETEAAARRQAPRLDPASSRVMEELRRLLDEPGAPAGLAVLRDLGVPWIVATAPAATARIDAARDRPGSPDLPAWALRLGVAVAPAALARAAVPGWARAMALATGDAGELAAAVAGAGAPSDVDRLLAAAHPATAVAALAEGTEAVAGWWTGHRDHQIAVTGADLVAEGVTPGPAIGRALAEVRAAMLDGRVGGREQQLALALAVARGERS